MTRTPSIPKDTFVGLRVLLDRIARDTAYPVGSQLVLDHDFMPGDDTKHKPCGACGRVRGAHGVPVP